MSFFLRLSRFSLLGALLAASACNSPTTGLVGGRWVVKDHVQPPSGGGSSTLFGTSVDGTSDYDGDGANDVLVAAPAWGVPQLGGGHTFGATFVYFDAAAPPSRTHSWGNALAPGWYANSLVKASGDLDGDSVPDYAYSGGSPNMLHVRSGTDGSEIRPPQPLQYPNPMNPGVAELGCAVSGGGDVDGDGVPDLLLGSTHHLAPGTLEHVGGVELVSGADGSTLWGRSGILGQEQFLGTGLAILGDINQDGHAEFLVGLDGKMPVTGATTGRAILYGFDGSNYSQLWQANTGEDTQLDSIAAGRDLDGDGVPDFVVADLPRFTLPIKKGLRFEYVRAYSGATQALIWKAGFPRAVPGGPQGLGRSLDFVDDLDGDGTSEILVGLPFLRGAPGDHVGGFVALSGQTGRSLGGLAGSTPFGYFSFGLSSFRDVDDDGFTDVLVGSLHTTPGASHLQVVGVDPFLTLSAESISASGGPVIAQLDFPASEANKKYVLLISAAGAGPHKQEGVWIPLSPDPIFDVMVAQNVPAALQNVLASSVGVLNADGDGAVVLHGHADLASHVGATFYVAAVSANPGTTLKPRLSSMVRRLAVVP